MFLWLRVFYFLVRSTGSKRSSDADIDTTRHRLRSARLSTFIIKVLPVVKNIRKDLGPGYALTPVSNSFGCVIYAGAEVGREKT